MNNGAHKGASPDAWQIVHDVLGNNRLWQLHYAVGSDPEHNVPEEFIANPDEKNDSGTYIKVLAFSNGMFEVSNPRNHKSVIYGSGGD
jgi:hypothetical protein